jgi:uncharacterized membrane protein (DUF485 family)
MRHWSGRSTPANFETIDTATNKEHEEGPDFVTIQRSDEFVELRSRLRRFVFPVSVLFFLWYLGYVLLAAYGGELMTRRLFGSVNVGLLLGLLQFATTVLITGWYLRFARRRIDPRVAAIRAEHAKAGQR